MIIMIILVTEVKNQKSVTYMLCLPRTLLLVVEYLLDESPSLKFPSASKVAKKIGHDEKQASIISVKNQNLCFLHTHILQRPAAPPPGHRGLISK